MNKFARSVLKHRGSDLQADERLVTATFVAPVGTKSKQMRRGAFGGLLGALMSGDTPSERGSRTFYPEPNVSTALGVDTRAGDLMFPRAIIALTDQRLLFYNQGGAVSLRPTRLLAAVPLEEKKGIVSYKNRLTTDLTFLLVDGSNLEYETDRLMIKAERFVEAYRGL